MSGGSGQHEPPEPRARPQHQPKPACTLLPFSLPPSLPPSLPLFVHEPQPHRLSRASQGDSSRSSHGDGCRAPACPMEEAQGNTLVVRIGIPDLQQTVSSLVTPNSPFFLSLLSLLCSAPPPTLSHSFFVAGPPARFLTCSFVVGYFFPTLSLISSISCLNKSNQLSSLVGPGLTLTTEHLSVRGER